MYQNESTTVELLNPGTVNPVEDFQALVDNYGSSEVLERNSSILEDIIHNLITVGATGAYFRKAVACLQVKTTHFQQYNNNSTLQVYRSTSISCDHFAPFNNYLKSIKHKFSTGPHDKVWSEIQKSKCTLISTEEVAASDKSTEQANSFLSEVIVANVEAVQEKMEIPSAEADFFDDME